MSVNMEKSRLIGIATTISCCVVVIGCCAVISGCSSNSAGKVAVSTATKSVKFTVDQPSLAIVGTSAPDSVFDGMLFKDADRQLLSRVMERASNDVFGALDGFSDPAQLEAKFNEMALSAFDPAQLGKELMAQTLREARVTPQRRFTGWRVKVEYTIGSDNAGEKKDRFQRWCYIDPSGTSVVKSFDIPVTW